MRMLLSRIAGLFRQWRRDRDLDDEIRFHLDMLAEPYVRRGMSTAEARQAALRQFGGVTQMKEAYRDQRGLPALETLAQDTKYGVRTLLRTPGFTLAAVLTLALGIGANAAIFSVVNAVLLRPLPYPDADRIVRLVRKTPDGEWTGQTGQRFIFFRDNLRSFEALAAWRPPTGINVAIGDSAEFVQALPVSKEFFQVFGVPPLYGSGVTAEHDRPGGPDVVVLGYAIWLRYFAGSPSAIGRSLVLGGRTHTIIGVMPATFTTIPAVDLFVPLRTSTTGPGGGFNYTVAGRLKPGVTREQAVADAAGVFAAFSTEFPTHLSRSELPSNFVPFQQSVAGTVRPALILMLGAVGALLLIACANTANLLLARASGRAREIAVRAALGAGRGRIVRQLLTESVLLAFAGAALGLVCARWAVPALLALTPPGLTVYQDVRIDTTVLGVTLAIALATGLLFGLAPALTLSRSDIVRAFKDDGARTTASGRAGWARRALVVVEVALCMLLLVGAGLLIQTFVALRAIDPGFDDSNVLTGQMSLQGQRYADRDALNAFFDRGLERIRAIPGVQAAAIVNGVPIAQGLNLNVDVLDGPERIERALTDWRYASADYFRTMGIPIVAGRGFEERDRAGNLPVAVVNEEFARRFFKGTAAIGRHIRVFKDDGEIEIVGIAKDVREQGLVGNLPAVMYVPVTQANPAGIAASHTYFPMSWVVRASNAGPELARQIREAMRAVDPQQPFSSFRTMEEVKMAELAMERFQMTLLGAFAGIGLLLSAAGIYGLIAYSVSQRTREIGIRVALGATRTRILWSVLRQGTLLAGAGVVAGAAAAWLLTGTLASFIWGVSPLDPATFAGVALILVSVAALASLVPAIRAIRQDPVRALRSP